MSEINFKVKFCKKYFDEGVWDCDVLNQVDILLKDQHARPLLYIESKYKILNETAHREALAQVILTNKKQKQMLNYVALIFQDEDENNILELIDCSEDSVMFNHDLNWNAERASSPTKDAVNRINDRISNRITRYKNNEIKEFYLTFKQGDTQIKITEKNFNIVYHQWKNELKFIEEVLDEHDLIDLFLVDILNGEVYTEKSDEDFMGNIQTMNLPLIREGTNLSRYQLRHFENSVEIKYNGHGKSFLYTFENTEKYNSFWKKYKRPPLKEQFKIILERSATLYSDKYRRDTGGEYTPSCFVEVQNKILNQHYDLNEFIVFDPCAGVGNLENQFGRDFKEFCYLSTLEQMDVDICKIKKFENVKRFDYLENSLHPKFQYKGECLDIKDICEKENKKLMVIMNPPYKNKKGFKNNIAIEFFNKVVSLEPEVIVFYYMTETFFRKEVENYINSNYKIISHVITNAKTTFFLSEWSISQIIFSKNKGEKIDISSINVDRYEIDKKTGHFVFIKKYTYNNSLPYLIGEIDKKIKQNQSGLILGNFSYLNEIIKIGNGGTNRGNNITTKNLIYCLLSKGLSFNSHHKYFELNHKIFRGRIEQIPEELFSDAIMFSLFYKGFLFSNKEEKNYIMPFSAQQLGCSKNNLNVLFLTDMLNDEKFFDFREFLNRFDFSKEATNLFSAALEIFHFYHRSREYQNKNWNDSFYDITNAIMGKNNRIFKKIEATNDKRITKTRTTKGTRGFGRNTIKYVVSSEDLPIFMHFFDVRDMLARKINRQLLDCGLLLWERENIY